MKSDKRVPYFSQWANPTWTERIAEAAVDPCDDPSWVQHGFDSEDSYRFWSRRICGIACLESVLDHWRIPRPCRSKLVEEALEFGVYVFRQDGTLQGLIYEPFCKWVRVKFGVAAEFVVNVSLAESLERVPLGGFAMASVSQELRRPYADRTSRENGGHLALVVEHDVANLCFHNPSGVPPYQANALLPLVVFDGFFARRGILLSKGS